MNRRTWTVALAGALVAAVVGIGAVMAQEDDGSGQTFLDRVAAKLGIGSDQLERAIRDARTDQINEAVQNGNLTQEQADALIERLDEAPLLFDHPGRGGFGRGDFAFGLGRGPGLHGLCGVAGEELAAFLGIDAEQLREELRAEGATLATVAEAHGKTRDELKAFISQSARARLDERVADGDITQDRADEIMATLEERLDAAIDRELPFPGKFRFRFGPNGDDGAHDGGAEEQAGTIPGAFSS